MVAYNFQLLRIEIPKKKKIEKPSKKKKVGPTLHLGSTGL